MAIKTGKTFGTVSSRGTERLKKKIIPENAVLIDRPDDIIKASIPYMIIPCIVCFVAIFTKKAQSDEFIFNLWFMPLSFIIGFFCCDAVT